MTELYIDKQLVVLPETFSITIIEENPFFTKNGKYTYDISLSLRDPTNAKIYKHLNRLNRKGNIPKNRSAYLVVDNEVVLNGTEIILEHTESEVKIQLVSGNSELNFLIGGDRKLRDLDLGKAYVYEDLTFDEKSKQVLNDLKRNYPDRDFQFLPYCVDEEDIRKIDGIFPKIGNSFQLLLFREGLLPVYNPFVSGSVPQPYLCFIIAQVLKSLGYSLTYNAIAEHKIFKNIYIVHGFRTKFFSKMLPSWTVVEFLSKIEEWLDCVFIINPYNKTVRLMFNYQADYKDTTGIITVIIEDEFSIEEDSDNVLTMHNSNISYSLDSELYYQYMQLDTKIKDNAKEQDAEPLHELISKNKATKNGFEYILKPSDTTDRFIAYQKDKNRILKKVDSFRALYNNMESEEIDKELDIIPAAMNYGFIAALVLPYPTYWFQVPIAADADPLEKTNDKDLNPDNEPINIQSLVEGESSIPEEKTYSKMRVAIYSGLQKLDGKSGYSGYSSPLYPIAYVESLAEYFTETEQIRYFGEKDLNPFRLDYLYNEVYSKSKGIDTLRTYKLTFMNKGKIDIMSKFIANNRSFRCVKIERTVTHKGFDKKTKGYFYSYG